jgi:hypothetical protein
MLCYL